MTPATYYKRLPEESRQFLQSEAGRLGLSVVPAEWPEEVFSAVVCRKYRVPFLPFDPGMVDMAAFEAHRERCDRLRFLPLFAHGVCMVVASPEAWSEAGLREIRNAVRLQICPVGVLDSEFDLVAASVHADLDRAQASRPPPPAPKVELHTTWEILDEPIDMAISVLRRVHGLGASDVLVQSSSGKILVRARVDGKYTDLPPLNLPNGRHLLTGMKLVGGIPSSERNVPRSGRGTFTLHTGSPIDVRLEYQPTALGDDISVRILDPAGIKRMAGTLPFDGENLQRVQFCMSRAAGLILITGPTGSGKTTTLYRALTTLNAAELNIRTAEDPVEYIIDGISQMTVKEREPDVSLRITWADALRSQLRFDPDVLLVGEIRGKEEAQTTVETALTGHLVFSTLHTNDATKSITRLLELGISGELVRNTLMLVVAQRLCARLCPHCRIPEVPSAAIAAHFKHYQMPVPEFVYATGGCEKCKGKGTDGRLPIFEVLHLDSERLLPLIKDKEAFNEPAFRASWRAQGGRTLAEHGLQYVALGDVPYEEVGQYESDYTPPSP